MIEKITSGGQTGVDRAALDAGLKLHIPIGGACPRGRLAEDGPIDSKYPLLETATSAYEERTYRNVTDTDGTLILHFGKISGGTALTRKFALAQKKPLLVVDLGERPAPDAVLKWIAQHGIANLNVAGPRESNHPGIYRMAYEFLLRIFEQGGHRIT